MATGALNQLKVEFENITPYPLACRAWVKDDVVHLVVMDARITDPKLGVKSGH